ncbi:MAG: DUF1232 domain-containing protein [Leptolyngbyaceae cyanobacterium SM1_3_5]|nr:DUF1232 domain-containing protein [Leptolyngbyaceae cyanobacterium SM1_3_5]
MNFSAEAIYGWYRSVIRNPKYRWWIILGTVAYLLSPIDLLPDVIPVIGQIDDAVIVTALVAEMSQLLFARAKSGKSSQTTAQTSDGKSVDVNAVEV